MSTHSRIAVVNEDGSVKSIYCHFDGYYSHNGKILLENYSSDFAKVKELIDLGNISSLGENIEPEENCLHSWENPQDGVVVAYHRDRGESLRFEMNESLRDLIENVLLDEDFLYVFENGKWICGDCSEIRSPEDLKELTEEMCQ